MDAFDGDPDWRKTHVLADGTQVLLRPVLPSDKEELARAFREASPATRYLRFLSNLSELSEPMLTYLTEVDQQNHVAIVAVVESPDLKRERGVGVARLIRLPDEPAVAEAAVSVADDMQRRGIGTLLVKELALAAHVRGIARIRADVLATNAMMRAILESAGARPLPAGSEVAGTVTYDVTIEPDREALGFASRLLAVLRGLARRERSGATPSASRGDEGERDAERDDGAVDRAPRRP